MPKPKIGLVLEALGLDVRQGLRAAAGLGFQGVQIDATSRALAPEALTQSGRRDLRAMLRSHNLQISALGGNLGRGGFAAPAFVDEAVGRTRRIIELAADLDVGVVTTFIGQVPEDRDAATATLMAEALNEAGRHAENYGRFLATETGAEPPARLAEFLGSLDTEGIRVNYDPGNLAMAGFDPAGGVFDLKGRIVHTHAKDGRRHPDGSRQETPLGEGDVDWLAYIAALDSVGYDGFLTIEGDLGADPIEAARRGKAFLERF